MNAISPTREQDFPLWYQEVVKPLAQNGAVRGTQVIKPWGYRVWELMQMHLDKDIKVLGHDNFYAPLFVGLDAIAEEAKHIDGFAKECAVVTHSRLTVQDGELIPDGALTEPVIVRPTSEAIIGPIVKDWINSMSYHELPLLLNQWANVVRWEMRTRLFLRSSEFLWQEGHTFHASATEAQEHAKTMLNCYRDFFTEVLALPTVVGEKSENERFAGANHTYTLEMLMQDGKALQGGTSHDLAQNFSKAYDITFTNAQGQVEHVHGTSWGVTTRMIGAVVMVHADDDGLRMPPRIAPLQVVVMAFNPKNDPVIDQACHSVSEQISQLVYQSQPVRVKFDQRKMKGGGRAWGWVKKGVPIRIEIGPRDIENGVVTMSFRTHGYKEKQSIAMSDLNRIPEMLQEIQDQMFNEANQFLLRHISEVQNLDQLWGHFEADGTGFVKVAYAGDIEHEKQLAEQHISIRCLVDGPELPCVFTGEKTTSYALIARAY